MRQTVRKNKPWRKSCPELEARAPHDSPPESDDVERTERHEEQGQLDPRQADRHDARGGNPPRGSVEAAAGKLSDMEKFSVSGGARVQVLPSGASWRAAKPVKCPLPKECLTSSWSRSWFRLPPRITCSQPGEGAPTPPVHSPPLHYSERDKSVFIWCQGFRGFPLALSCPTLRARSALCALTHG